MTAVEGPPEEADMVIVGAGMAGLGLAAELEKLGGSEPLVIEAGPVRDLNHYRYAHDDQIALSYWLDPEIDPDFWRPYEPVDDSFAGIAGLRRRVGGRSLYWHGVTLPMDPWALWSDAWPHAVAKDLSEGWHGGDSLYAQTTAELADWAGRSSLTSPHTVEFAGYRLRRTPQAVREEGDGRWRAYSPVEHWCRRERLPPVISGCHAIRLLTSENRITGVRVRWKGATTDIRTGIIVLAAGTIENSRLSIQVLRECGRLREPVLTGLADKVVHGFSAVLDPHGVPSWLAESARKGGFLVAAGHESLRSNLFVRTFFTDLGAPAVDIWLMGEHRPGRRGFVRCEPAGGGPWPTRVGCSLDSCDLELAAAQRTELDRLRAALSDITRTPLTPLRFDEGYGTPDLPERLTAANAAQKSGGTTTYSFPLGSEQHESGTLPMGSVVDSDQRFVDIEGLFATGPCVFPRAGAANPALTVLALAKRLADVLTAI